jgi:hypothetical protein
MHVTSLKPIAHWPLRIERTASSGLKLCCGSESRAPISLAPRFSEVFRNHAIATLTVSTVFLSQAVETAARILDTTLITSLKRGVNEMNRYAARPATQF